MENICAKSQNRKTKGTEKKNLRRERQEKNNNPNIKSSNQFNQWLEIGVAHHFAFVCLEGHQQMNFNFGIETQNTYTESRWSE